MKKAIGYFGILLIASICIFYFWGSSEKLNREDYTTIFNYENRALVQIKDTFSICTYNIGYLSGMTNNLAIEPNSELYNNNLTKAKNLFKTMDVDFIGFQEIDFNSDRSFNVDQMTELANFCGFNFGARAINWDKNYVPFPYWPPSMHFGEMLSGQGVLSKYSIAENKFEILKKPESNPFYYNAFYLERLAQISRIELNHQTIIIINVHLEAYDQSTRAEQAQTVLKIFNEYAEEFPVLLIGDFNSTPPFATNGYKDDNTTHFFINNDKIGVAIDKDQYLANETSFFTFSSEDPQIKIDYIFYNKNKITPVTSRVVSEAGNISDHLPVWFEFTLVE